MNRFKQFVQKKSGIPDKQFENLSNYAKNLNYDNLKLTSKRYSKKVFPLAAKLEKKEETKWLYEKLYDMLISVNEETWNYDLLGFYEDFWYVVYDSNLCHEMNWHYDMGSTNVMPRKLSMTLQLNDPKEYDGGDLDIMGPGEPFSTEKEKGLLTVFPSYIPHRVTRVTRGIRKVIVAFAYGPHFR